MIPPRFFGIATHYFHNCEIAAIPMFHHVVAQRLDYVIGCQERRLSRPSRHILDHARVVESENTLLDRGRVSGLSHPLPVG
jgi:hypothetical protein